MIKSLIFYEYQKFDFNLQENNLQENNDYYNLVTEIYHDYERLHYDALQIIKNNSINKFGDYNSINLNMCIDICKIANTLVDKIQCLSKRKTINAINEKSKKMIQNRKKEMKS